LVGPARGRLPRPIDVDRIRDLGRAPGRPLRMGAVSLPVLLAPPLRRARVVRAPAGMVAGGAAVLGRPVHPVGPRRLPRDLLLLPRRVLQGVLGRPALVRGGRAPQELPRRALVPARPAERPPLFPLPRPGVPRHPPP